MAIKDVLENRYNATVWDDNRIPSEEQIKYVAECSYLAPSKQCYGIDKLVIVSNSERGKKFKDWMFYHDGATDLHRVNDDGLDSIVKYLNGTFNAPFLFVWLIDKNYKKVHRNEIITDEFKIHYTTPSFEERENDCFVSATCAMFAALELGMNTSFASCDLNMRDYLSSKMDMSEHWVALSLGIGYAKDTSNVETVLGYNMRVDESDRYSPIMRKNINQNEKYYQRSLYKKTFEDTILKI